MPKPKYLNKELIELVRENLNKIPLKQIASIKGCSEQTIRKIIVTNGWKTDPVKAMEFRIGAKKKRIITTLSPEHDQYIQDNYLNLPNKTIARNIGRSHTIVLTRLRQLGLVIPAETIQRNKEWKRFKPGLIPENKGKKAKDYLSPETYKKIKETSFQKGNLPHNTLYDGAESIRTYTRGYSYTFVRISKGKWKPKQIVEYERIHGPIPKGFCLRCKSSDTTNADLNNWNLVSSKEHAKRNGGCEELSDGRVLGNMVRNNPELKEIIKKEHPELIELKRQQLFLNRKIKSHEQKQNTRKT